MLLRGQFQGLFRGRLQDLRVGSSGSVELSRVKSSRVGRLGQSRFKGPGLGRVWAWAWRVGYGDWLRNAGSDVAIGCIIMEGCYD